MNAEQLLQHFERISEAPDALPRLRRFILDLAVRGKLVEQDPSDEPASELLKRIAAEKARLVKAREIKNEKPLAPIEDADFDLPKSWTWTRLGKVTSYIQRGKSPKYAVNDGSLVVSQKCVQWSGLDLKVAKQITLESLMDYEKIRFLRDGDLLWNSTGTGTIGRIIKAVDPPEKLVCDSHVTVVRCLAVVPEYIRAWLRSDQVYALIEDRAAGSTNQVELTAQMAINQVVPLPPLAEQHRIVAKVDELMNLCDQLEAAKVEREKCRDRLVAASLQGLNQPAEEEDTFREHASFTFNNLPRITTRAAHIKQLRQTTLNLAVLGKLVAQDPSDEPASELLKRISAEKARLVKSGRIKRSTPALAIAEQQSLFELPQGWVSVLWNSIALKIGDIDHKMPESVVDGIPYISPRDFLPDNQIDFERAKRVSRQDFTRLSTKIKPDLGDIIYPRYGTIGENRLVQEQRDFLASYSCCVIKVLNGFINPWYQYFFSISSHCRLQAKAAENKTTQSNVGIRSIQEFIVPLPPLAEQHRIVAKVDELMAICDQLEAQITLTEQDSRRFLESVLADAIAPGGNLSAEAQVA